MMALVMTWILSWASVRLNQILDKGLDIVALPGSA